MSQKSDASGPQGARRSLFQRRPELACQLSLPTPASAEIAAALGYDAGLIDIARMAGDAAAAHAQARALSAGGAAALIRPASAMAPWLAQAMDLGADGVLAPGISDPAAAARAAAAVRFGGDGGRDESGAYGPAARYGADLDYAAQWNARAAVLVEIASPAALSAAAEIAAAPGVDGLFFAPRAYAAAAGRPGAAAVRRAFDALRSAAASQGCAVGSPAFADLTAGALVAEKLDLVIAASDADLLRGAAEAALRAAGG